MSAKQFDFLKKVSNVNTNTLKKKNDMRFFIKDVKSLVFGFLKLLLPVIIVSFLFVYMTSVYNASRLTETLVKINKSPLFLNTYTEKMQQAQINKLDIKHFSNGTLVKYVPNGIGAKEVLILLPKQEYDPKVDYELNIWQRNNELKDIVYRVNEENAWSEEALIKDLDFILSNINKEEKKS